MRLETCGSVGSTNGTAVAKYPLCFMTELMSYLRNRSLKVVIGERVRRCLSIMENSQKINKNVAHHRNLLKVIKHRKS